MMLSPDARRTLKRDGVLSGLRDEEIDSLLGAATRKRLLPGQVLFYQGRAGDTMFIVADGTLSARVADPKIKSVEVSRIRPGDLLGEMACIDPAPRSTTVVASTEALVFELSRESLLRLRDVAPRTYVALLSGVLKLATSRLRGVEKMMGDVLDDTSPQEKKRRAQEGKDAKSGIGGWLKAVFGRAK